jgi:putative membrane protein
VDDARPQGIGRSGGMGLAPDNAMNVRMRKEESTMKVAMRGVVVLAFGATLALCASAQQADQTNFLADAIRGNVAEVKLGQLAAERAESQQVREYGDMLRKDHTRSLEKASSLASEIGVPASSELTAQQQKQFESLQKLSGDEFDTTFLSQMVSDHQTDIAKFSAQAQTGSNPEVMAYAKETLPTLQSHLQHAQSIQSELKSATQSGARPGPGARESSPSAEPSLQSHDPEPLGSKAPAARTRRDSGASDER